MFKIEEAKLFFFGGGGVSKNLLNTKSKAIF